MTTVDARVRDAIAARGDRARALIGNPTLEKLLARATTDADADADIFSARDASTSDAPSPAVSFVDALRARARFESVGALRACAAAFACASSVSRADPSLDAPERLRDEHARAKALTRMRGHVKWAWARESACRGARATRAERYEEAETCFAQALELDPKHARAYACRGACRANQRKYAAAMEDFDRALRIDGTDARAKAYRDAVDAKMRKIEDERRGGGERSATASGRVVQEDVSALRARVLNPARGLEALRRGEGTKTYDLELGGGEDSSGERSKKKTDKEKRRKRHKRDSRKDDHRRNNKKDKRRKKMAKSSRRDASSSSSSSDSESNS